MKFIHLSDLHIGKRVNEFSMLADQRYILSQILDIAEKNDIDAVLIAGDVYDRSVPAEEAVALFDDFVVSLTELGKKVFIISGNHDSARRLSFLGKLVSKTGVYISPVYRGACRAETLCDEYGKINIYMLPFVKPSLVKSCFPDEDVESCDSAVRLAIDKMGVNTQERNIILSHQFVTGSETSDSEEISVGGTDNVDADAYDCFDYVALGHIHKPQKIKRDTMRYCGTPLKYSFSEENNKNSVVIVELKEKGSISLDFIPLVPIRDMRTVRGSYEQVTLKSSYENTNTDDYVRVVLTDEEDIWDGMSKLRAIYPNIMKLEYDNKRRYAGQDIIMGEGVEEKSELELFSELYEQQNGQALTDRQEKYLSSVITRLKEDMI